MDFDDPRLSQEPNDATAWEAPADRTCGLCGIGLLGDEAGLCGDCEEIPA